jgi:hypothetical protein
LPSNNANKEAGDIGSIFVIIGVPNVSRLEIAAAPSFAEPCQHGASAIAGLPSGAAINARVPASASGAFAMRSPHAAIVSAAPVHGYSALPART